MLPFQGGAPWFLVYAVLYMHRSGMPWEQAFWCQQEDLLWTSGLYVE